MWFKQLQLFKLGNASQFTVDNLINCLTQIPYTPCLPSMAIAMGWSPIIDEENAPMVRAINDCFMFCLQIEEKILPAAVVRKSLAEKTKQIETRDQRKVGSKEKYSLKDDIIKTLLPKAFSKITRIYAFIDVKNSWLVLGTTHAKKTEHFISLFKKTIDENIHPFELKKVSPILTHWLREKSYPTILAIEKSCVLQDPKQENRIIRCQQQDLFTTGIQSLIKDGCEVKQLALSWQDQLQFVLAENLSLRNIQFLDIQEEIKELEPETQLQRFDADFLLMTATFSRFLEELLSLFLKSKISESNIPDINIPSNNNIAIEDSV